MPKARGSVLVVGAGIFGSSAALELARRGWDVAVIDRGVPPHPAASSTDVSKVVRMDYGADDFFTELAGRATEAWSGWPLPAQDWFRRQGFLLLKGDPLAEGTFEGDSYARLERRGVPVRKLDAREIRAAYPAWNADLFPYGYFNPTAGWVPSASVVRATLHAAETAGARLLRGTVIDVLAGRPGVRTADGSTRRVDRLVVAAGAWANALLPELDELLEPVGQPVLHLRPADPRPFRAETFPTWGADIARTGWYGFSARADGTVKLGHHGRGLVGDPSADARVGDDHVDRCRAFLSEALPGLADAEVVERRVCYYSDARDGYFLIDHLPDREGVVVAGGGSGHGFKFAPVLGGLVADALEGRANAWLGPFAWRKPSATRREGARYVGEPSTEGEVGSSRTLPSSDAPSTSTS